MSFTNEEDFLTLISDRTGEEYDHSERSLKQLNTDELKKNDSELYGDYLHSKSLRREKNEFKNTNAQIIEKYTQQLLELQNKLNENLSNQKFENSKASNQNETTIDLVRNQSAAKKNSTTNKVKFKNVIEGNKDVILKKLLKTIDLMNQELSKKNLITTF